MKRYHTAIPHGAHVVQEVVGFEADESPGTGVMGFAALINMLRTIVDQPTLLRHANDCPQKLEVYYNGCAWVIEARSLTTVSDDDSASGSTPRQ